MNTIADTHAHHQLYAKVKSFAIKPFRIKDYILN